MPTGGRASMRPATITSNRPAADRHREIFFCDRSQTDTDPCKRVGDNARHLSVARPNDAIEGGAACPQAADGRRDQLLRVEDNALHLSGAAFQKQKLRSSARENTTV